MTEQELVEYGLKLLAEPCEEHPTVIVISPATEKTICELLAQNEDTT